MYDKWMLIDILENKDNSTVIYNVKPINKKYFFFNNKYSVVDDKIWVMKRFYFKNNDNKYSDELNNIEKYKLYDCKFCISMPENPEYRFGHDLIGAWYTMEKYDGNLKNNFLFGKNKIKLLISNIIDFFEWLHITKSRVHGDVKVDNILVKFTENERPFVIIDYESISEPENILCLNNLPNGYYYYGLGCKSDKPYISYRMDLEAFGYILWSLTLSVEQYIKFNWQRQSFILYETGKKKNEFNLLDEIRNNSFINTDMNDLIKSYFNIISKVDWFDKNPNPDVYKQIRNII